MDREAWRAAIHGVAKSWIWLSDWTELNLPRKSHFSKVHGFGTSPADQWLRLCAFTAGGMGSIPGQGTKIPHPLKCGQNGGWGRESFLKKSSRSLNGEVTDWASTPLPSPYSCRTSTALWWNPSIWGRILGKAHHVNNTIFWDCCCQTDQGLKTLGLSIDELWVNHCKNVLKTITFDWPVSCGKGTQI